MSPILLDRYERARAAGTAFLLSHVAPDGRVCDSDRSRISHYRVPWALEVSGETATAFRVLDWIERTGLGADGQFHGGRTWDAEANATTNTYPETILSYGAWLLRRYDIARQAMAFAAPYQDQETGGVYMTREETGEGGFQLLFPTAQFGMSALMTGDMQAADGVGTWLETLWNTQPELPDRMYTMWTRSGGLVTTVPIGVSPLHVVDESQSERQLHYNGGIGAAFLAQLGMASGEGRWIDLARKFEQFSIDSTPEQFKTKQVCKSAWGAGLLYMATKDEQYLPWLVTMGDWFADGQEADGGWSNTSYLDPDPPLAHRIELTAEFVVHLDTVIGALGAAAARQTVAS